MILSVISELCLNGTTADNSSLQNNPPTTVVTVFHCDWTQFINSLIFYSFTWPRSQPAAAQRWSSTIGCPAWQPRPSLCTAVVRDRRRPSLWCQALWLDWIKGILLLLLLLLQKNKKKRYLIQFVAVFIDRQLNTVADWWHNIMADHNLFSSIVKPAQQYIHLSC